MLQPSDSGHDKAPGLSFLSANPRVRGALIFLLYLVVFIFLDLCAHSVQVLPGVVAWYPPDGLSFAFLLTFGTPFLPAFAIASILSSLFVFRFSMPLSELIGWAILISIAYGLAVWFLKRRFHIDTQLRRPRDLFWMITATAAVATILAMISVSGMTASGAVPQAERLSATAQWWIGEMIGVLVITPVLLIHVMPYLKRFAQGEEFLPNISFPRISPLVLTQILSIFVMMYIAFNVSWSNDFHPYFLVAIPLLWIAIQHGLPGASLGVSFVSFATVRIAQWHDFNFVELGQLQLLMLVITLASLLIGIIVSEHKQSLKSSGTELARQRNKIIYELIIIAIIGVATWILEYTFDFFEAVTAWERRYKIRGLDETLVTISVLGIVWAVFSYRRWKEVELQTRARAKAQVELQALYDELEARVQERTAELSKANEFLQIEIAERRQAERALRESEQRFRLLFTTSPDAILLIDPHDSGTSWPIVDCNEVACQMNGYGREDLIGQSVDILNISEGTDEERRIYLDRLRREGVIRIERLHRHKDGHTFPVEVSTSLFAFEGRELILGIDRDITERKQVEEAILQSEKRFRALIENSSDAIALLDSNGVLLYDSPSAPGMLGYGPDEMISQSMFKLMHPDDLTTILPLFRSLAENLGARSNNTFRLRHKNGSWHWVESVVTNLLAEPGVQAIVANYRDVTERKQAEEALIESDQRFRDLFENSPVSIWEEDFSEVKAYLDRLKDEVQTDFESYLNDHPDVASTCANLVKILDVNQVALELQGADTKAALLENLSKIFTPKTLAAFQQELITIWNRERRLKIDGVMQTLDGQERNVTIIWVVVPGYEENYSRVLVSLIDITERKLAEEEIRSRTEELSTLYELSRALADAKDLDQILYLVNRRAVESVHTTFALTALLEGDELITRSVYPIRILDHELLLSKRNPISAMPYFQQIMAQDEPVILRANNQQLNREERAAILPDFVRTLCLIPLRVYDAEADSTRSLGLIAIGEARKEEREPFTPEKLRLARSIGDQAAIAIENARLFNNLEHSNADLRLAYDATIAGWSAALDLRDKETEGHTQRVTQLTVRLAERLGFGEPELIHVRRGALLHDIGKMGVPDRILLKPDKLTEEEWVLMRMHPTYAYQMLKPITYLGPALDIPYSHHEKWDGTGYPRQLRGEQIPLVARIFSIIDVYDALTSDRPYRRSWSQDKTLHYIRELSGSHFDPQVVELFLRMINETS